MNNERLEGIQAAVTAKYAKKQLPKKILFSGTEWIRPLKTVEAIAREGWEQEHCAANYSSLVAEGRQYLYCVLKPLRGTLAISRNTGTRRWNPSQFRQAANAPVPETIVKSTFESLFNSGKAQKQATVD